jgi:hypothetical protein
MVEPASIGPPRISRETRRLLLAALIALVVLWMLARFRSTDGGPPQGPVQPFLDQIAARPSFSDLAEEVSRVYARLQPSLLVVNARGVTDDPSAGSQGQVVAFRVTNTLAMALLPPKILEQPHELDVLATDAASGFTLLNVEAFDAVSDAGAWAPQQPETPRYLWATTNSSAAVSLRPVFVAGLEPITRPAWPGQLWKMASPADVEPGAFVFTTSGELAGLVIEDAGGRAIASPQVLKRAVDQLRDNPDRGRGHLGLEVQPMTRRLAAATGASGGVVVSWVDPEGPSAGALQVGDVLEEANGERLTSQHWAVRAARLVPGETVTVRARRDGEVREVVLLTAFRPPQPDVASLGLTMRVLSGIGSEVTRVEPGTAAHRAGVEAGDVITLAGKVAAPTPAQVRSAFAADPEGHGMLLALTRGTSHRVVVVGP